MLSFISGFSDSFLMAVFLWPFAAAVLTLPVLLVQYVRFHKVYARRMAAFYLLFLYILALFAFTLYPLPDNPEAFCQGKAFLPRLNPLGFWSDVGEDGLKAVLQGAFNVVFFAPIGMFMRNLFGKRLALTVWLAFGVSLTVETAQLTGMFGAFPCSYRLFDTSDLIFNVLGAAAGFGLARWLPDFSKLKKREHLNDNPGIAQRAVVFLADYLASNFLALVILAPSFWAGAEGWRDWLLPLQVICFGIFQVACPLIFKGKTPFGALTGAALDDRERGWCWRLVFYGARAGMLGAVVFLGGWIGLAILAVIILSWVFWRKMPYKVVDIFFGRK